MSGLHAIQALLNDPEIKLKRAASTRWLSHERACQSLRSTLPAVLTSLEREATERSEPMAIGLLKTIKTYKFVATLYLMCDLLPHLARLSCMFQAADIDLSQIQCQVTATLLQIRSIKENGGTNMRNVRTVLSTSLKDWNVMPPDIDTSESNLKNQLIIPYVEALEKNICNRFLDAGLIGAFSIFDPKLLPKTEEDIISSSFGENSIEKFCEHYGSDPSPVIDIEQIKSEWSVFSIYMFQNCKTMSLNGVLELLSTNRTIQSLYPNLSRLATICRILPVSTVDCERAFSTMKRIKTRLRSVMRTA